MRYTLSLLPALSHWLGMVNNSGFMLPANDLIANTPAESKIKPESRVRSVRPLDWAVLTTWKHHTGLPWDRHRLEARCRRRRTIEAAEKVAVANRKRPSAAKESA
jgi:hypothetical protein